VPHNHGVLFALGQERTFSWVRVMSAIHPKADSAAVICMSAKCLTLSAVADQITREALAHRAHNASTIRVMLTLTMY
jgi:hypothetical protein